MAPRSVGNPVVPGAKVVATVLDERRGPKIIVFKYKPKVRYRRITGHRQDSPPHRTSTRW